MAKYQIGSIGSLISGKASDVAETKTIVYKPVAQEAKPKKRASSDSSTFLEHGKKIKDKVAAAFSKKRKVEIAGDEEKSKTFGVFYSSHHSEDISEVDDTFARNAARRVHIKNNTRKHIDDPERDSRTVFVGNIPYAHSDKKKLIKFFSNYGQVESVRVRCAPLKDPRMSKKVAVIKNEYHPERSSISAYVVFKTSDNAKSALEANGEVFHDHHLRVDAAKGTKEVDPRKSVFLGNVPFGAEEEDLWQVFSGCGPIESVRIVRDPITAVAKGIAFINFKTADAAELALHLDGHLLKKRNISVNRHRPSAKSTLQRPLTEKPIRHKLVDDKTRSKISAKDEKRAAKKAKRTLRRDNEKVLGIVKKKKKTDAPAELKKEAEPDHVPLDLENTAEKTKEDSSKPEEKKGKKGSQRFQGQTVDESKKKKKKKVNKGAQKKKKIALLLSGGNKKKKT